MDGYWSWSTGVLNEYWMNTVEYYLNTGVFFLELELHFFAFYAPCFHFFALFCTLCEFANVNFLHFCVTLVHFCVTSVHFCVTSVHFKSYWWLNLRAHQLCALFWRFRLMSNWFELIWNFKTPRRHHRDTAGWLSGAFGLKTRFQKSCPRFARKRSEE